MVAVITRLHVIVANAGDSRAILVVVSPDGGGGRGSGRKALPAKAHRDGGGGGGDAMKRGSAGAGEEKADEASKAAAAFAAALGLSLDGGKVGSAGGEEVGGGGGGGGGSGSDDGSAAGGAGAAGGLNDSVRLEEQEEDEEEEPQDALGGDSADSIRALLGALTLGGSGDAAGALGGEGDAQQPSRGGIGSGASQREEAEGRKVEVTAMSRDHTAQDERERERVTAAGGKAFEVRYKDDDGMDSMVVRTAYDSEVEGQSVMPTRGFGDLYYKQKKDGDGKLLSPGLQVSGE